MINRFAIAFAIFFGTIQCEFWQRVNYPQSIEMEFTETTVQLDLTSCVAMCDRKADTLVVSYKTKNCFCLVLSDASTGRENVSFIFLKYYDYFHCLNSGYDLIYPHLDLCMKFYKTKVNWSTANQRCIADGARLMTLNTEAKCNITANFPTQQFAYKIYVGGIYNEKNFVWNTGEEIRSCWAQGEPNNPTSEKCVAVFTGGDIYLHDVSCSSSLSFLCEKSTVGIGNLSKFVGTSQNPMG